MIRKADIKAVEHLGGGRGTAYVHHIVSKDELLGHIESFQQSLAELRGYLESDNREALCRLLEGVRTKRIAMSRIEG